MLFRNANPLILNRYSYIFPFFQRERIAWSDHYIFSPYIDRPSCGHRLIHTCRQCRAVVDEDWDYCPYCSVERKSTERRAPATVSVR